MSKEEQELLDKYRKMTPGNKLNLLSNARVALAVQENTRLELAKEAKKPPNGRKSA
jgi:hypothetical protein